MMSIESDPFVILYRQYSPGEATLDAVRTWEFEVTLDFQPSALPAYMVSEMRSARLTYDRTYMIWS